ncbi:MAG: MerR family transcriptional regulator [Opitutaceae bacterium]
MQPHPDAILVSESEVARRANVTWPTVRTLRDRGVIVPSAVTGSGVRLYAPDVIALVQGAVRRPAIVSAPMAQCLRGAFLAGM